MHFYFSTSTVEVEILGLNSLIVGLNSLIMGLNSLTTF